MRPPTAAPPCSLAHLQGGGGAPITYAVHVPCLPVLTPSLSAAQCSQRFLQPFCLHHGAWPAEDVAKFAAHTGADLARIMGQLPLAVKEQAERLSGALKAAKQLGADVSEPCRLVVEAVTEVCAPCVCGFCPLPRTHRAMWRGKTAGAVHKGAHPRSVARQADRAEEAGPTHPAARWVLGHSLQPMLSGPAQYVQACHGG